MDKITQFLQKFNKGSKEDKPTRPVFQSAVKYQQQKQQDLKEKRQKELSQTWQKNKGLALGIFIIVILVLFSIGGIVFLRNNNTFNLTRITVKGLTAATPEEVEVKLDWAKNKNLYAISTTEIRKSLLTNFPYFKDVFIRKILPNRIDIEVIERFPVMTYVNLATSITLDDEGKVIGIFANEKTEPLLSDILNIIQGYGDVDSLLVQDKYLSKITDERAKARVKYETVKVEDKRKALEEVQQEQIVLVETQLKARADLLGSQLITDLPQLQDLTNQQYKLGDTLNKTKFDFGYNLALYFQSKKLPISRILWQTDFNVIVSLKNESNAKIIFTTSRPLSEQLIAVENIRRLEPFSKVSVVDVRSNIISVR